MNICNHIWVYENKIMTTYPPQQRRICKKCGKLDTVVNKKFQNAWKAMMEKFKKDK